MESDRQAEIYYNLNNPLAYTGDVKKLMKAGITSKWLEQQPTFTLHRAVKRKFPTRKYRTSAPNHQWQADLVDMQQHKTKNRGFCHILTAIDIFSRYAYAQPIKSKVVNDIRLGFLSIFKRVPKNLSSTPLLLQTDQGKEFESRDIQSFFKKHGIKQFSVMSPYKASLVERFHRTLRSRMYRYFTKNGTRKWYDVLQKLVDAYNNSKHSALYGYTPAQISNENAMEIWDMRNRSIKNTSIKKYKFKIGDLVRLAITKRVFSRGYTPNWTEEIFQIASIDDRTLPIMYCVRDLETGEVIKGKFYTDELQAVANIFRIERILRTKKVGNKILYYVKWMGFKKPTWINSTDLVR